MNIKRLFLYALIISVAVSAVVGIGVVIFGNFGEFETRVLMTTTTITVVSILGLACGAYLETGRARVIPLVGIAAAIVSGVLWIISIWVSEHDNSLFFKAMASATLIATSCAHFSLLSLARLERKFLWSRYAVFGAIYAILLILLTVIWLEIDAANNLIARSLGALAIVAGALTIITPVFHKLSRKSTVEEIDAEIGNLRREIEKLEAERDAIVAETSNVQR